MQTTPKFMRTTLAATALSLGALAISAPTFA